MVTVFCFGLVFFPFLILKNTAVGRLLCIPCLGEFSQVDLLGKSLQQDCWLE